MKTYLLSALYLLIASAGFAQVTGCNEIFISEYIEGWSNNKAIELYNPTNSEVDLSGYRLERYSNGSNSADANQRLDLEGIMPPLSVYVIVIDKRDPDGTGQEAPVWDELQEKADIFMCPVYDDNNAMYFNGNDALVLRKISGNLVIDTFGKIGQDPGNPSDGGGWNNVGPDYTWTSNLAVAWTTDHSLMRKSAVISGDTNPIDAFDVSLGFDSLPANTFENLGSHMCECGNVINSVEEISGPEFNAYPNPSSSGKFFVQSPVIISEVRVLSIDGKIVLDQQINRTSFDIDLSTNPAGIYMIQIWDQEGRMNRKQVVRQ